MKLNQLIFVGVFGLAGPLLAQTALAQNKFDTTMHKVEHKTGEAAHAVARGTDTAAHRVARGTASVAAKGAALVTDKVYKGKEGPNGQTVYIDKNDRKFYVDDKGKRVYLKKSQIRDKKSD